MIDLRSDTVTKPTQAMLGAMFKAQVGDDVFKEDPTVIALENRLAKIFGMEAGLFCPSGTMCNQIAIKAHTQPMDEIICHKLSHIYYYETAGFAFNSGCSVRLLEGNRGMISAKDVEANIQPDFDWLPVTSLVVIENTCNKGGGSVYSLEQIQAISKTCKQHNLKFHLDGARIFNALVASNYTARDLHGLFDSVSICLSKGLGCPIGSVLAGSSAFIKYARKIRKAFGGGMRQAGYLAAAGMYALDNHVERLQEDHNHAKQIAEVLKTLPYVAHIEDVETNILVSDLDNTMPVQKFLKKLEENDIRAVQFGPNTVRFVTHLDVAKEDVDRVIEVLEMI